MVGGEDVPFKNATYRDRMLPRKVDDLITKIGGMVPAMNIRPEFSWAGTFGHTEDGLPYIGRHADQPGGLFALGYGGNGITFSTMAAWILTGICTGQAHPDEDLFSFERPTAGRG